jgi:hypothetical protein
MREAARIVASLLGVFAGIGGPEHGIFEIMRGNVRPETIVFASMGLPCQPEEECAVLPLRPRAPPAHGPDRRGARRPAAVMTRVVC